MKSGQSDSLMVKNEKGLNSEPVRIYDEAEAPSSIAAKYVEIWPVKAEDFNYHQVDIDVLGYREIRVFANLFADEYKTKPLPKEALLEIRFGHDLEGVGTGYGGTIFKREVTSYIEAFVIEKIYFTVVGGICVLISIAILLPDMIHGPFFVTVGTSKCPIVVPGHSPTRSSSP